MEHRLLHVNRVVDLTVRQERHHPRVSQVEQDLRVRRQDSRLQTGSRTYRRSHPGPVQTEHRVIVVVEGREETAVTVVVEEHREEAGLAAAVVPEEAAAEDDNQ